MGNLEKSVRKTRRRQNIQKIILSTIYSAGLLSVAVMAPNVLKNLDKISGGKKTKRNPKYTVNYAIERLLDKKLIYFKKTKKEKFVTLTKEGELQLKKFDFESVHKIRSKRKWDKKWRIIIFDIKEENRSTRAKIRNNLIKIGFLKLQNSVWVYPYDCEDLIVMIKAEQKIGKDVLYIISDRIENDTNIKKHFKLK